MTMIAENAVYEMDALELLRGLPDASVDCVLTDPPYNGVKADAWDNQWATDDDFIAWIGQLCEQWKRVLKPNGSLYVFASPRMAARVEVEIGRWFNVLNSLVWYKTTGNRNWSMDKQAARSYLPNTERIIFAEQFGADTYTDASRYDDHVFEPIRRYLQSAFDSAGVHTDKANEFCNTSSMASRHYFAKSQWAMPTRAHYAAMRIGLGGDHLSREYDDLYAEYEALRRPFRVSAFVQFTDVWNFAPVQPRSGKHPCEKPLALLEHMIAASTRPGDVVLDTFAGSGATLDAARRLGRRYIGNDFDPHWVEYARRRLSHGYTLPMMFEESAS
jgi:adenine-specific DNA-methyltransferase